MGIRIYTDSASDITLEELKKYDIGLIPMPLDCGGNTYIDDKTIPVERFWEMLLAGKTIKTSQPAPDAFLRIFREAQRVGDAVICILISSGLSGTYQGALMARSMVGYDQVFLIDAHHAAAAAAEKMLAFRACQLRDAGQMTAREIAEELTRFQSRVQLFACIDTLEYLARGGRLSRAAASLGGLMHIKPVITLADTGEIKVLKKVPGAHNAMREMTERVMSCRVDTAFPVIPIYAYEDTNCRDFLSKLKNIGFSYQTLEPQQIGATIGAYIGPGGYGLVFVEAE